MSNVLIEKQKIDILANAISDKSGVPVTMTLDEMVSAVDGIETGGGTPTLQTKTATYTPTESQQTDTITADSGYDGLDEVDVTVNAISSSYVGSGIVRRSSSDMTSNGATVTAPAGYYGTSASKTIQNASFSIGKNFNFYTENNVRKWRVAGSVLLDPNGDDTEGWIGAGTYEGTYSTFNAIATGTSITPTESQQTIGGANYMMEGAVTVNAIPSNYVGSGVTQRSSSDLTASGATVTAPAGYYGSSASKSVASGTAGTPTATKGTVSNHSVSVTPSVTNTTGYITGSTKTGTAVTVSASELVSGSETKTANGTYDVTNLASLVVAIPIVTYYTGSSAPSSSTGSNGDIYLQTT